MPPIQVKDCPDEVYEGLKRCASRDNRNLSQEMLHILGLYIEAYAESPQARSRSLAQTDSREGCTPPARLASPDEAAFASPVTPAGLASFTYAGANYTERRNGGAAVGRLERRKAAFARIAKLPAFTPKGDGVTTADLLRESREEAR